MTLPFRQHLAALRLLAVLTLVLGVGYPFAVMAVGRLVPDRADGSLVRVDGRVVGSRLIGQEFAGDQWFQPRPSVAGDGYDPMASGASNLGPQNPDLLVTVKERKAAIAARDGVPESAIPPDAVTASGSGLDPDISPAYARLQVDRVAAARGLEPAQVTALVEDHIAGPDLGFLGAAHVNVLELNLALLTLPGQGA
ncbi:MAG: potassium-transporting ATPase subunit KdpC [Actinomycetales bacterium]|nr:potassium-transporting ATPase subunit KdpC [Actinomycetales bacterium]